MKINEITRTGGLVSIKGQKKPSDAIFYDKIDFDIYINLEPDLSRIILPLMQMII